MTSKKLYNKKEVNRVFLETDSGPKWRSPFRKDYARDQHERAFSIGQKIKIWENTNGMVRINNQDKPIDGKVYEKDNKSDFIKIDLMEVLNGEKWVVDHVHPHTEGGQTTIENGEITSRSYNLWKNKNKYDLSHV